MGAASSTSAGLRSSAGVTGALRRALDTSFRVTLDASPTRQLGLRLSIILESDTLRVVDVVPGGLVDQWNEQHQPHERIRPGLWIISVNGDRGTANNMLRAIHTSGHLELLISPSPPAPKARSPRGCRGRRVSEVSRRFPVSVEAVGEEGPGIEVVCSTNGLEVLHIHDRGGVQEWNKAHPEEQIRAGDRIVFVNGAARSEMLGTLWRDPMLHMVLRRGLPAGREDVLSDDCVAQLPALSQAADGAVCGICLADLDVGQEPTELPCRHAFHRGCVAEWLTKHSALCPFCNWAADHPAGACRRAKDVGMAVVVDEDDVPADVPALRLPESPSRRPKSQAVSSWMEESL
mmetsp:Transcript_1554/g.3361  ORF Transcript_1554/g.3361 Transcript_1554/m.3361 type:complete len:347 (-) Transcript_1554:28-1068(-)